MTCFLRLIGRNLLKTATSNKNVRDKRINCLPFEICNLIRSFSSYNNKSFNYNFNNNIYLKNIKYSNSFLFNIRKHYFAGSVDPSKDYYKELGVSTNATRKEIRAAYLKLAKQWHPDVHSNKSQSEKQKATEKFQKISNAYEVLSDKATKKDYDDLRRYQKANPFANVGSQAGKPRYQSGNSSFDEEFRRQWEQQWANQRRSRSEQNNWANSNEDFFRTFWQQQAQRQQQYEQNNQFRRRPTVLNTILTYVLFFMAARMIFGIFFHRRSSDPWNDPYYNGGNNSGRNGYYGGRNRSRFDKYNDYNNSRYGYDDPILRRRKNKYESNDYYNNDRLSRGPIRGSTKYTPPNDLPPQPKTYEKRRSSQTSKEILDNETERLFNESQLKIHDLENNNNSMSEADFMRKIRLAAEKKRREELLNKQRRNSYKINEWEDTNENINKDANKDYKKYLNSTDRQRNSKDSWRN